MRRSSSLFSSVVSHCLMILWCLSETLSSPPSLICNRTTAENSSLRSRWFSTVSKWWSRHILLKSAISAASHKWTLNLYFTLRECFWRAGLNRFRVCQMCVLAFNASSWGSEAIGVLWVGAQAVGESILVEISSTASIYYWNCDVFHSVFSSIATSFLASVSNKFSYLNVKSGASGSKSGNSCGASSTRSHDIVK